MNATPVQDPTTQRLIAAVLSNYSGKKVLVERLHVFADPARVGIHGVRWFALTKTLPRKEVVIADFVVDLNGASVEAHIEAVEEVEFASWPPTSSAR